MCAQGERAYPMHFPRFSYIHSLCVYHFSGIKVVMCVVDVGSFDSKSLTPSNQKRTHTHSYTPLASRKNEQSLRSEQDEPTNCSRSEKSERKSSEWQGKKPVHTIPSCTECLIHFNVQYKIMFDYISDIFTRLVHEMHAQHCVSIFLSTSSATAFFPPANFDICVSSAGCIFIFLYIQMDAMDRRKSSPW